MRRLSRRGVAFFAAGTFFVGAYPAYAWVCHPDPAGTRTLVVHGAVTAYTMAGDRVEIPYREDDCARVASWEVLAAKAGNTSLAGAACGATSADTETPNATASIASDGTVAVATANGSSRTYSVPPPLRATHAAVTDDHVVAFARGRQPDRPDRALVFDRTSGILIRNWPLLDHPASIDVAGDLAIFGTRGTLYALRLSTGRIALVGLNRAADSPQIERAGVVYIDDLYKGKRRPDRTTLKFVPKRTIERALTNATKPLVTRGRIRALAMDATRVGVAIDNPDTSCDSVVFWNIPWHYDIDVTKLLMPRRLTCPARGGPRISDIAFGGVGLEWVADYGKTTKLLTATLVNCDIRIVTSGHRVADVAGDGGVLAYALRNDGDADGTVAVVSLTHHHVDHGVHPGRTLGRLAARSLAADAGRVAALDAGGRVELRTAAGRLIRGWRVPGAAAVALRGDDLVTLGRGRIEVFDATSGRLVHRWQVPARTRPQLDVHHGVAVLIARSKVIAVDIATGSRAIVASAPAAADAQIEAPGIAYGYNAAGRGYVRFVPFAQIERALGRA